MGATWSAYLPVNASSSRTNTEMHLSVWEKTGTVMEMGDHNDYVIKVDGSGRLSKRTRTHLRPIQTYDDAAPPRMLEVGPAGVPHVEAAAPPAAAPPCATADPHRSSSVVFAAPAPWIPDPSSRTVHTVRHRAASSHAAA